MSRVAYGETMVKVGGTRNVAPAVVTGIRDIEPPTAAAMSAFGRVKTAELALMTWKVTSKNWHEDEQSAVDPPMRLWVDWHWPVASLQPELTTNGFIPANTSGAALNVPETKLSTVLS